MYFFKRIMYNVKRNTFYGSIKMKKKTKIVISVAVALILVAAIVTVGIISASRSKPQGDESTNMPSESTTGTGVILTVQPSIFDWNDYINSLDIPTSTTEVSTTEVPVSVTGDTKPNVSYIYVFPSDYYYYPGLTTTTAPTETTTKPQVIEYSYSIDNTAKTVTLTKYTGNDTSVRIPDSINGYPVVAIADGCFSLGTLEKAWISANVKAIGNNAFENCTKLEVVYFLGRDEVTIGRSAFAGCKSLRSIYLSLGTTSIGDYCFENCTSLKEISIPDAVTHFGDMPFRGIEETLIIKCTNGSTAHQIAKKYDIAVQLK